MLLIHAGWDGGSDVWCGVGHRIYNYSNAVLALVVAEGGQHEE